MHNEPGIEKVNPFTQLIHEVNRVNREGGSLAGRGGGTPIIPMGPMVRSAEILREPVPLSPQEVMERDAEAIKLGIMSPEEAQSGYSSWEDAAVAGRPTQEQKAHEPVRQTAREFVANNPPRLIDFKRIQGIDLIRGIAYVDDFEIPLPEGATKTYKEDVLDLAVSFVTQQLALALAEVRGIKSETMYDLSGSEKTETIQEKINSNEEEISSVSNLPKEDS